MKDEFSKVTKRTVDASLPKEKVYIVFDGAISGFGLIVYPSGQKSWIFEYRPGEGGRRVPKKRLTIGKVKDFTADEARREADRLRAIVKVGGDPQGDMTSLRKALTVSDLSDMFLTNIEGKRKPTTHRDYSGVLRNHVLPAIGSRKAVALDDFEVAKLHRDIGATSHTAANKAVRILSSMYGYAASPELKLVPKGFNPAQGIEKYKEHERERVLSMEELERLGNAIRVAETVGVPWDIDPDKKGKHRRKDVTQQITVIAAPAAAALRLLIFTGARLREILKLKWESVDFDRGLLILSVHKTSGKVGMKTVVLNAPAVAVLRSIPRVGKYVIAGESAGQKDEKPRSDLQRPWGAVRRFAGLDDVVIHDLRHNFGTFGASGGLGLPLIGKLLGHANAQSTERYAHFFVDPQRQASDAIGSAIAVAIGERTSGRVVPMKGRKR